MPDLVQKLDKALSQAAEVASDVVASPGSKTTSDIGIPFSRAMSTAALTARHAQNVAQKLPPLEQAVQAHGVPKLQDDEWASPEAKAAADQVSKERWSRELAKSPTGSVDPMKGTPGTPTSDVPMASGDTEPGADAMPRGVGLSDPGFNAHARADNTTAKPYAATSPQRRGGWLGSLRRPWERMQGKA